jgi:hypothetical protein
MLVEKRLIEYGISRLEYPDKYIMGWKVIHVGEINLTDLPDEVRRVFCPVKNNQNYPIYAFK